SVEVPVLLPEEKLEVGLEMQYRSGGEAPGREGTTKGLAIGPTLAWRPTKNARFDLSPLIGTSDHTPAVQVFAVFSFSFGVPTALRPSSSAWFKSLAQIRNYSPAVI